ncbi:MAG: VWA domain-containing protein [Lachnospiraceae bacterium]|nr:VWA domain-containing protein [Lachnospiraceae bacterium]
MNKKTIGILATVVILVCAAVFGGIYLTRNLGKSEKTISKENAGKRLSKMVEKIDPKTSKPVKSPIEYDSSENEAAELPDIDTCPVGVKATTDLYAEIYSSPEKAGTGTDGWLCEMAEEFNKAGHQVNGKPVSIQIRKVNSGQALDYIATGKAVPEGFAPSSMLWVNMLNARGTNTETISERLVGNVAGILLSEKTYNQIVEKYGSVDLKAITEATEAGEFSMGYTNPFASSAGLNFLICTLQRYDLGNPLSDTAVQGFQKFQKNVPFVSLTTMQMRDAAENGSLDGFIMEYQSYANDTILSKNYKFTPYGYRHDNPLVSVAGASQEKKDILNLFAQHCAAEKSKKRATEYGFNQMDDYLCEYGDISGDVLTAAQKLYKTNKDSGRPVIGVFVTDVSGSMGGEPLKALQTSLINSMKYINTENYIGLVSYSDDVTIEVPIKQFNMEQQTYFKGAVENLYASGGTATFDGICVAMNMINELMEQYPDAKPMLFVLSDGETNTGYNLNDIRDVLTGLKIPVYTIGYNADLAALESISSVNEAASIDASTDDVVYQLKILFNANM